MEGYREFPCFLCFFVQINLQCHENIFLHHLHEPLGVPAEDFRAEHPRQPAGGAGGICVARLSFYRRTARMGAAATLVAAC